MVSKIVYVSGALSDVPADIRPEYIAFYEAIAHTVESLGLVAYLPHQNSDPIRHKDITPKQVDQIDRQAVTSAMLAIAVCDNPSLGVGIEVEMAYHANTPVILVCHNERIEQRRISRLIRGNPSVISEIIYTDQEDALEQIKSLVRGYLQMQAESILPTSLKVPRS